MLLAEEEKKLIRSLVKHYSDNKNLFDTFLKIFAERITGDEDLRQYVHSFKWRSKSLKSLKDKLELKFARLKENGLPNDFTKENLFLKINDLAGFRILYLHTSQFDKINETLLKIFKDEKYLLVEGPKARVWDDEYRTYYQSKGIETVDSGDSLYTSIHYVINTKRHTEYTVEIQVRTLADELWGEVDHKINYKHKSKNLACLEQIKVLARVTSSCTRLVDSIFNTYESSKNKKSKNTGSEINPTQNNI